MPCRPTVHSTHLYLGANGLQPAAAEAIVDALRDNGSVSHLFLESNAIGDQGTAALAQRRWSTLGLASNGIGAVGVRGLVASPPTALHLGYARSARLLHAEPNVIGDSGGEAIATILQSRDGALQDLTLARNGFTTSGVEKILEAVEASESLQWFNLPGRDLPPWTRRRIRGLVDSLREKYGARPSTSPFNVASVYR